MQVKSRTSQAELNDYFDRFRRDGSCNRFFFVCHSAAGALSLPGRVCTCGPEIAYRTLRSTPDYLAG